MYSVYSPVYIILYMMGFTLSLFVFQSPCTICWTYKPFIHSLYTFHTCSIIKSWELICLRLRVINNDVHNTQLPCMPSITKQELRSGLTIKNMATTVLQPRLEAMFGGKYNPESREIYKSSFNIARTRKLSVIACLWEGICDGDGTDCNLPFHLFMGVPLPCYLRCQVWGFQVEGWGMPRVQDPPTWSPWTHWNICAINWKWCHLLSGHPTSIH